jgi:hypothetical protein
MPQLKKEALQQLHDIIFCPLPYPDRVFVTLDAFGASWDAMPPGWERRLPGAAAWLDAWNVPIARGHRNLDQCDAAAQRARDAVECS